MSNQKCVIQPALIHLYPDKYSQEFCYYPFTFKSDRCVGSCNTLNDWSNKVDSKLSVLNMISGTNEYKILTKYTSCECKSRFDEKK